MVRICLFIYFLHFLSPTKGTHITCTAPKVAEGTEALVNFQLTNFTQDEKYALFLDFDNGSKSCKILICHGDSTEESKCIKEHEDPSFQSDGIVDSQLTLRVRQVTLNAQGQYILWGIIDNEQHKTNCSLQVIPKGNKNPSISTISEPTQSEYIVDTSSIPMTAVTDESTGHKVTPTAIAVPVFFIIFIGIGIAFAIYKRHKIKEVWNAVCRSTHCGQNTRQTDDDPDLADPECATKLEPELANVTGLYKGGTNIASGMVTSPPEGNPSQPILPETRRLLDDHEEKTLDTSAAGQVFEDEEEDGFVMVQMETITETPQKETALRFS